MQSKFDKRGAIGGWIERTVLSICFSECCGMCFGKHLITILLWCFSTGAFGE